MANAEVLNGDGSPANGTPPSLVRPSSTVGPEPCARVLSKGFVPKPGTELFNGVVLGRELGAGVQAKVFDLVDAQGSSVGKVLKLGHKNLHGAFLNQVAGSMMDMEHEWQLGMQLKAALERPDGTLPGFTRTCDCVVMMHDTKRHAGVFTGMIMEKLNGWPIHKRIMDPSFHNIHYIREMLFQTFSALDRAQRAVGFNHADLGLNNVMEVYPRLFPELAKDEQEANAAAMAAAAEDRETYCAPCAAPNTLLPGRSSMWRRSQTGSGCSAPPPIAGFSVDSDGKLAPLGPHVEFKIIDYGVGEFNEDLAQAAGGYQPEETLKRIHDVFQARGIPIGPRASMSMTASVADRDAPDASTLGDADGSISSGGGDIELVDEDGDAASSSRRWKLSPFGHGNRFLVKSASPKAATAAQKAQLNKPSPSQSTMSSESAIRAAASGRGAVERMYRNFWARKGDVFHLLLALAVALDDRVWPKEDERDVQLFISLVHHVTGIKMKAWFACPTDPRRFKVMGKRHKHPKDKHKQKSEDPDSSRVCTEHGSLSAMGAAREPIFGARVRCFAALRRARIMMAAHLKPFNSGLLAGEALVSPFFGLQGGAPHAVLPVCVEAAFPFRSSAEGRLPR